MNPAFKYNFSEIGSEKPSSGNEQTNATTGSQDNYAQPGHNRNICFHLLDGYSQALNYNYLVSQKKTPDQCTIKLEFTTARIQLDGFHLQKLFDDIMHQLVMHVHCVDARYNTLEDGEGPVVNRITIAAVN